MVRTRHDDLARVEGQLAHLLDTIERHESLIRLIEQHLHAIERRGLTALERLERHLSSTAVALTYTANPPAVADLQEAAAMVQAVEAMGHEET